MRKDPELRGLSFCPASVEVIRDSRFRLRLGNRILLRPLDYRGIGHEFLFNG